MAERFQIEEKFKKYEEELISLRRYFHKYPELALSEVKTSAFIEERLKKAGYQIKKVPPTGLIAELSELKNREKTVVLRAEMDALPIQEATGLPYASCHEGCMHACGHDGILATALMLAEILATEKESFPVNVRFLFEPAEEIGEGAQRMIDAGALDGADAFYMFHYACDQELGMAVHEGQASAMIAGIKVHIHGKSSHWCDAENGIDSIYGASCVIQAIHRINKEYQRKAKCLIGIGTVQGGTYPNIIADHVVLHGNIRACYDEDFEGLKTFLEQEIHRIEKETGTSIELEYPKPPVLSFANDEGLTYEAKEIGEQIFGKRFLLEGEDELFLSGDNAYRYFKKVKGLFSIFLAGLGEDTYPLHHPKFQIDERILIHSLETLYKLLISAK